LPQDSLCFNCGWEVRDSDIHCCFCGARQREIRLTPPALVLAAVEADAAGAEVISPGQVEVSNAGRQSVYILGLTPPAGIEVVAEPPLDGNRGSLLRMGGALRLHGRRTGDLGEELPVLVVQTSIGPRPLPVHARPLPPLKLDPKEFLLAKGQRMRLEPILSLPEGVEWVQLSVQGTGLTLVEPAEPVRLETGSRLRVVLEAEAFAGPSKEEPPKLIVQLADGASLRFELSFKEARPARLAPVGGMDHLDFRIFPQETAGLAKPWRRESLVHEIELRNIGMLDYPLAKVSLVSRPERPFRDELRLTLHDAGGRHQEAPLVVAPGQSLWLRIECPSPQAPGSLQDGTLVLAGGEGFESLRMAVRLDSHEPREYRMPVGLDFGTTASAVATRVSRQDAPGSVLSISFRPRFDETRESPFLPSDVQIVRASLEGGEPDFEIDWGDFRGLRHLTFARNLKRRLGLKEGDPESLEPIFLQGVRTDLPVEDLAAFVVYEMKRQVERRLGERLVKGIATVPTRFSLRRIQAIRRVYQRAGFRDVTLIDESVAAGILGMYNQFREREKYTFLVYDMGGGTTDVTLFEVENARSGGVLEIRPRILGVAGDARLGGRDVTHLMMGRSLASLSSEERAEIPWVDRPFDSPELQEIAKRNQNDLFLAVEDAKLRLFQEDSSEVTLTPALYDRRDVSVPCTATTFTRGEVEAALRPRLERLWREIRDLLDVSGVSLDILYFVGRSAKLPIIRGGLVEWLTAEGRSPRLEWYFPVDREGQTVLKEAVSLGACLAQDLLYGIDERLVTEDLEERSASRFGIRDQRGGFREILPSGAGIGKPSATRLTVPLVSAFRSGRYQLRLEVWENPTRSNQIDGNPDAELVGVVNLDLAAAEVGPSPRAQTEVGLVLREDRTLELLVGLNGNVRSIPVKP
jgi:hypothetical protein